MRRVMIVGLIALGLAGCAAVPPGEPTADDVQRYYGVMLDKTWIGTGLSGVMERPTPPAATPVPPHEWSRDVFACMQDKGFFPSGIELDPQRGYLLANAASLDPSRTDSDAQLAFYMCLAAIPPAEIEDEEFLSPSQLEYVYDYYASWVVPCLAHQGWDVRNAPTREEFIELEGAWSPYDSMIVDDVGDFQTSEELCGPSRPPLR